MELKKVVIELRYKEINPIFNWRSSLYKSLTGTRPAQDISLNEGFELKIEDKKALLVLEQKRWAVNLENAENIDDVKQFLGDLFTKIHSVVNWGMGCRIGVRTVWIKKYENSMTDLVAKLKEKIYKDIPLVNSAKDLALNLSLMDGECKINYIMGPMAKNEPTHQYFQSNDDLPDTFILLDLDYALIKDQIYSKKYFKQFVEDAISYASGKASESEEIIL